MASGVDLSNSNSPESAGNISRSTSEPCTGLKGIYGLSCTAVAGQPVLVPYQGGNFSSWTQSSSQCLSAHGKMILHLDTSERCRSHGRAYYHRFFDCILPSWAAFMAAVEAASGPQRGGLVVVLSHPETLAHYFQPFLNTATDFIFGDHTKPRHHIEQIPCFVGAKSVATLFFPLNETAWAAGGTNAALFMESHARLWKLPPCSSINASRVVVLQRDRTRVVQNLDAIIDNITRATGHTPYVHRGKETWRQDVELFRCADVMVGFHGAGMVHGTFMRAGTTVIELTPTTPHQVADDDGDERHHGWSGSNPQDKEERRYCWRSSVHRMGPSYPHVGWVRLTIPWEDLKAPLGRPGKIEPDDMEHRVKNVLNVTVPETYYSTISDLVRNAVNIWGPNAKQERQGSQAQAAGRLG